MSSNYYLLSVEFYFEALLSYDVISLDIPCDQQSCSLAVLDGGTCISNPVAREANQSLHGSSEVELKAINDKKA